MLCNSKLLQNDAIILPLIIRNLKNSQISDINHGMVFYKKRDGFSPKKTVVPNDLWLRWE